MPAIGGSIESITINGRNFAVAADVDSQRKIGGFENDVQANGDGSTRTIKTRVPWGVEGLSINVDEKVLWINDDTAAHTITSGTTTGGPDGIFDSSLFMAGTTFEITFHRRGTYKYFDVVHPWIKGEIIVK